MFEGFHKKMQFLENNVKKFEPSGAWKMIYYCNKMDIE